MLKISRNDRINSPGEFYKMLLLLICGLVIWIMVVAILFCMIIFLWDWMYQCTLMNDFMGEQSPFRRLI